jgi:iron complex outermembrane recepter protein
MRRRLWGLLACLLAVSVSAQEKYTFDIPAQEASTAIQVWAHQSGLQVFAADEHLRGVRTNAVHGEYSALDAVRRLIEGTGLEVVSTGEKTVTIRRPKGTDSRQTTAAPDPATASLDVEEVVVTGSRIARTGFDTLQAALVTDAQQIRQRAYTNVAEALNDTPGFSPSGTSPIGPGQDDFGAGQSFVDLFGLGSQRTLTLVNGRRFVSSNTVNGSRGNAPAGQQVDLNVIPIGLVERVETIAIGGAPVYGSDAIAGTVNVILKENFQGFQLDAQYGDTEKTDASGYSVRGLMGGNFADDRGNAVIGVEFNKQNGTLLNGRSGYYFDLPNPTAPPLTLVNTDVVYSAMSEGGLPYNPATFDYIRDANGTPLQFGPNGTFIPFLAGADSDGSPLDAISIGGDGVRFADHISLLSPTQRTLINGIAHYDVAPWARAFMELSYARTEGSELSEVAAFAAPFVSGTFVPFNVDNPFLPTETRNTLVANGVTDFIVGRNFSDLLDRGDGLFTTSIDLHRVVTGLKGDFDFFSHKMAWDISYNYGRSRSLTTTHYINNDRLLLAMDAVRDSSGNIVCASGGACVPINLFGEGAFTDEAAEYVLDPGEATSTNTQRVVSANLSSTLPFGIGGADSVSFNIGTEFRRESGRFAPDALLRTGTSLLGLSLVSPYVATEGSFRTHEYYGELVAPVVSSAQNLRGIKAFNLEGAVRFVDNSIAGSDTTWSAGARFAPRLSGWADGLLFRGVYTRSIRAPAITELFSGSVPTRGAIDDVCDATNYNQGDSPDVRAANCAAELAAFGYASPADFNSTTSGLSPIGTSSGNPDLENEIADSWSVGLVYQPAEFPRFRAAFDWSNIEVDGAIESLDIESLIAACYDNPNFPNVEGCQNFRRLGSGEVGPATPNPARVVGDIANGYNSGYINTGSIKFAGLIVSSEYALNALRFSGKVFFRNKYDFVAIEGQLPRDNIGRSGVPKYSGQFNIGYQRQGFDALLQALWTSHTKFDPLADENNVPGRFNNIPEYWKFNSTLGYEIKDRARLQLVVNNLFDKKPSEGALLSHNFGNYDVLGRSYVVSLRSSF